MSEHARPIDHEERLRALDPERSFIVQAPAGSGKTELLTRRYLALLQTVDVPEEILAITFTRKAAAEMRHRILQALELGSEERAPADPNKFERWQLARAAHLASERKGWELASHPARLRIQTIDALNQHLARRLPVLSGGAAALGIADNASALYAEAVRKVIEHLGTRTPEALSVERLIRHLDNNLGLTEGLLKALLAKRDHWLDLGLIGVPRAQLRERLERALTLAVNERLALLHGRFPRDLQAELVRLAAYAGRELRNAGTAHVLTTCVELEEFPQPDGAVLAHWCALATLLLTAEGDWRSPKGINVRLGFPPTGKAEKAAIGQVLEQLSRDELLAERLQEARALPSVRYDANQWEILDALLDVLILAVGELELVMRDRGEADYVAAAIAARRALGSIEEPTEVALRLDYRLNHILVDEFQDTSKGQVALLRLLTAGWVRGDGRTLFCVGDPMQSIYRFREADVGLFLRLEREPLNEIVLEPVRLRVNFRSSAPIIDWVNRAFAQIFPMHEDAVRGAVAYTPSHARSNAPVVGSIAVHPLVGAEPSPELEAERVLGIVTRTLASDDVSRVAILVASRSHVGLIARALTARAIPFQAVDIDPLALRPVVQDLVALTRALVHLADRTAWLAVLRASWCGLTLADMFALVQDRIDATVWSLLNDAQLALNLSADGRARIERVTAVFNAALAEQGRQSLREWVERTWYALGGPALLQAAEQLADAQAYFDRLEVIERAGDLEDVTQLESHLQNLFATPRRDGHPRVEIMTIHKAKGLEFEVVILPSLDRTARPDDPPLLRWLELPRADAEPALLLAPIAPRGADPDPLHAWLGSIDKERSRFEKQRLLYVAATRAIRELHLLGWASVDEARQVKPPARDSFLGLLWPQVRATFESSIEDEFAFSEEAEEPRVPYDDIALRRVPLTWQAPLPEPGFGNTAALTFVEGELLRPEFDWAGETSRHIGTLVHREIERILRGGLAQVSDEAIESERYHAELAELGVPAEFIPTAALRVATAIARMLRDERGRWLLAGDDVHRESSAELALSGWQRGELVNAVIDRTFVDTNGVRWIVDFKTSTHEGGGLDAFLANEEARYRPQLTRYANLMRAYRPNEAIKTALYFPLLGVWREVEWE